MDPLAQRFRLRPDVAARNIGGAVVAVTPADSKVHELDEVGTVVFEACVAGLTGAEAAERVAAAYDVTPEAARRDVAAFLLALVARGVLEPS